MLDIKNIKYKNINLKIHDIKKYILIFLSEN